MDNAVSLETYALRYAKDKDPVSFEELFKVIKPRLDKQARRYCHIYNTLQIPLDDFLSHYYEAVWEAAESYDGRTKFTQRLNSIIHIRNIFLYRYYSSQKRAAQGKDNSIDNVCLMGIVDKKANSDITESPIEKEILEGFERTSERNGKIIKLLMFGCSNVEISRVLGANKYDEKTRKAVSRARKTFCNFVESNLAG